MQRLKVQFPGGRGVAMVLVLFTLAVVFILSFAFASAQSVSIQISRNITARAQARMIAEAGLEMAIAYVMDTNGWRQTRDEGVWVEEKSFGGGLITIYGNDGEDTDGDGVVDGDGDLGDDPFDALTLTAVGLYEGAKHPAQVVLRPSGQTRKVQVGASLRIDPGTIDSFDSGLGPYGGLNVGSNATVMINSTESDQIRLDHGGTIRGGALVGPGGDPNEVISNPELVTGATGAMDEEFPLAGIDEPTGLGPNVGNRDYTTGTISENLHCGAFKINEGGAVSISGAVTILVEDKFSMERGSSIELLAGATLDLYVKGGGFLNEAQFNMNTADPTRLRLYIIGTKDFVVENDSGVYATITGPERKLFIRTDGNVYGTFLGKEMEIVSAGAFHQDTRAVATGTGAVPEQYNVRWWEAGAN